VSIRKNIKQRVTHFRHALAYIDALPQLALLGLIIGIATGGVIVFFRLIIEWTLIYYAEHFASHYTYDNYTALNIGLRWLIIMAGTLAIAALFHFIDRGKTQVGISHTIDRLHNFQGNLPIANGIVQFIGATLCVLSGQSVGREGPAVHLGAAVASQIGTVLKLPNNSRHTLIACGVAAAISASFNTPLAGVIFAMEVVVMSYSIVGFVPVILASVVGTVISQAVFGDHGLFSIGDTNMSSLAELPYMAFMGLAISVAAAAFIRLNIKAASFNHIAISIRILLAGIFTAAIASFVPEIMGLGYDTINAVLSSQIAIIGLLIIALAKLVVTPVVIGLGMPGGIVGPTLVVGACIGGVFGAIFSVLLPHTDMNASFYVVLGMAGMMAAVINAPLAALIAVLELSANPNMILPAMLVIVVSCISTRQLFKLEGIFTEQLRATHRLPQDKAANIQLKQTGVMSIADQKFAVAQSPVDYEKAKTYLVNQPRWIVTETHDDIYAMPAADLAKYLDTAPLDILSLEKNIDLFEIPAQRQRMYPIHDTANLYEALKAIKEHETPLLYVSLPRSPVISRVNGIVRLIDIENHYQPSDFKTQ